MEYRQKEALAILLEPNISQVSKATLQYTQKESYTGLFRNNLHN